MARQVRNTVALLSLGKTLAQSTGSETANIYAGLLCLSLLSGDEKPSSLQVLDEIQAGIFDGMTYAEIEQNMPEEFAARKADKLGYRCAPALRVMHLCWRIPPV
jgi:broad specificity phosphatase PhoE